MAKVFLDSDFKCHAENDGTMTAVESDFFDGKCTAFLEGYRFVPEGESWTRKDGAVFQGEMISPWQPWEALNKAQAAYERKRYPELVRGFAAMKTENSALLEDMAQLVDEVYQSDMEMMGL